MNWIDVNNALPELKQLYPGATPESGEVLVWNGHFVDMGYYQGKKMRWRTRSAGTVTRWMPKPLPPKK